MTANDDFERFRTGAAKYAAYLETSEGRLRIDLALPICRLFSRRPQVVARARSWVRYRRYGGAPGATWSPRHVAGCVCPMLHFAMRAAREAGVTHESVLLWDKGRGLVLIVAVAIFRGGSCLSVSA